MPKWLRYGIVIGIALGVIALFGLVISSSDTKLFDRYFSILLFLNIGMAAVLGMVVLTLVVRLIRRVRQKIYGTRMTASLALMTALIGMIPATTIYLLSTEIVGRSIDSWFDQRVEGALDSGVTITRGILLNLQKRAREDADRIAASLSKTPPTLILSELLKQVDTKPGLEAVVFDGNGTAVASAGSKINALLPDMPTPMQIQSVATTGHYSAVDGESFDSSEAARNEKNTLKIRVIVPIHSIAEDMAPSRLNQGLLAGIGPTRRALYLQLIQPVPDSIAKNAVHLVEGYREYQEMMLSRSSLRRLYKLTLTLTLLLTVFASITAALSFAKKTTEPVLQLARGTRRVANGEFAPIKEFSGNGEINELTRSFNTMIKELKEARTNLEFQRQKSDQAQAFLAKVLTSISSGVMVLDRDGRLLSFNEAAKRILDDRDLADGELLSSYEPEFAAFLNSRREKMSEEDESYKAEYTIEHDEKTTPLYIQGTPMKIGGETAIVVVFDDLTQLIRAQRATAWGEVARRLAHEIKNPLTPIRLAAERLEWKLSKRLTDEDDKALVKKTTSTIVMQVDALTQMVNDFREYAKLPDAKLRTLNLNEFIEATVALYHDAGLDVRLELDPHAPSILGDRGQLRQIFHNLISNSLEAGGRIGDVRVTIRTKTVAGINQPSTPSAVKLSIMDNGPGFGEKVLSSAFEPYVTTKPTGSGLGLPMVKKILDEHDADIRLENMTDPETGEVLGALVSIVFKAAGTTAGGAPEEDGPNQERE